MKKIVFLFALLLFTTVILVTGCSSQGTSLPANAEAETTPAEVFAQQNEELQQQVKELSATIDKLTSQNKELSQKNAELTTANETLSAKVEEAKPWFELSDLEKEAEEKRLAEEKAKKEAEEKEKQEAAQKEREEKEKKGYDTGITYDQLSRNPEDYMGEKVKFSGHVLQVIEGDTIMLRVATDGKYDDVILVSYSPSIVSSRVLEDDKITVYGTSAGLFTYESTGSGDISIPHILVDKIDQ